MKAIFIITFFFLSTTQVSAQCMLEPWSLNKRVDISTAVVEGRVIDQYGVWDADDKNIYTVNTVAIYKVLKGTINTATIQLVTEGGRVGLEMLKVSPSLELQSDDVGIFMLVPNHIAFKNLPGMYKATASVQSFIKYDLHRVEAYDWGYTYTDIAHQLYGDITAITGEEINVKMDFDAELGNKRIRALSPPTITSFSLSSTTSGTSTELTIAGSNFGLARGSGKVGFKDANFGDGRFYYSPTSWSYVSWSNSQIKVIVPTRAGTGKVQVISNSGESGQSASDLTIDWAHLNVLYPLNMNDTPFFELQHVNDDNTGGYTWNMTSSFSGDQQAVEAFYRSMNEWKCETQMNWTVGATTANHDLANDGTNTVRWTSFGNSKLGVCYSRYRGCFVSGGNDMTWFVNETDIEFDSTINWYFGIGLPANNQYDFESVTTHELGHGHQLGHVRASQKVMHYSINNGQRKPNLVTTDIAAGNYVKTKSITNQVCGIGKMTQGQCPASPPTASFDVSDLSICPNENNIFTSNSMGKVDVWNWSFGAGANMATAMTEGPHTVSYTTSGSKTIRLITSNANGADTATRTITVNQGVLDIPIDFIMEDTACLALKKYSIDAIPGASSYTWGVKSGGAIVSNADTNITVDWQDTGVHTITVKALGGCGDSPLKEGIVFVMGDPIASYTYLEEGITVAFESMLEYTESVSWDFGDGGSSTEENPSHRFVDQGDYTVILTAVNRCGSTPVKRNVNAAYGVGVAELYKHTSIFPNPIRTGENLHVEGANYETYEIYRPTGAIVQKGDVVGNQILLNVSANGLYILLLKTAEEMVNYKINVIE
jgi:PKD repeat protein